MKKIILASTSTLFGENYLAYLEPVIRELFQGIRELVFVPYARPGGISHEEYTQRVAEAFEPYNIKVTGLHSFDDPIDGLRQARGIFTGGGNTFLLVKQLHDLKLMSVLKTIVEQGIPYLGTSAGSNIGGINMQTTNDMPIVYPSSFETMGLVPFNLNPHYLDPDPGSRHNGETRATRIAEFHTQQKIPVVGLREGSWIKVTPAGITTEGSVPSRIFEQGKEPYELNPGAALDFLCDPA